MSFFKTWHRGQSAFFTRITLEPLRMISSVDDEPCTYPGWCIVSLFINMFGKKSIGFNQAVVKDAISSSLSSHH